MKPELINPEKVLECIRLYRDPNHRATKRMIAYYLDLPYSNSHNDQIDRQIRDAITQLRKQGEPIISTSGKAGYWYDRASIDIVIAYLESRIRDMSETVRALRRGKSEAVQLELACQ